MKNKVNKSSARVKYSDEPIKAKIIRDFLPSSGTLVLNEKKQGLHK